MPKSSGGHGGQDIRRRFRPTSCSGPTTCSTRAAHGASTLHKPRFMLEAGSLAAVDVGEATHLVLQHLDFSRRCDRADLTSQLAGLVARKLVAKAQADVVDVETLLWLAGSR